VANSTRLCSIFNKKEKREMCRFGFGSGRGVNLWKRVRTVYSYREVMRLRKLGCVLCATRNPFN
jgi:hypothetical protein